LAILPELGSYPLPNLMERLKIDIGESPADHFIGNSRNNPLVVKTTNPAFIPIALFSPCQIPFYSNICKATEIDRCISFGQDIPSSTLSRLFVRESSRIIASSIESKISKNDYHWNPRHWQVSVSHLSSWKLVKAGKRVLLCAILIQSTMMDKVVCLN